jgi:hypothetical protein
MDFLKEIKTEQEGNVPNIYTTIKVIFNVAPSVFQYRDQKLKVNL